jgi:hypothetical protein
MEVEPPRIGHDDRENEGKVTRLCVLAFILGWWLGSRSVKP